MTKQTRDASGGGRADRNPLWGRGPARRAAATNGIGPRRVRRRRPPLPPARPTRPIPSATSPGPRQSVRGSLPMAQGTALSLS